MEDVHIDEAQFATMTQTLEAIRYTNTLIVCGLLALCFVLALCAIIAVKR